MKKNRNQQPGQPGPDKKRPAGKPPRSAPSGAGSNEIRNIIHQSVRDESRPAAEPRGQRSRKASDAGPRRTAAHRAAPPVRPRGLKQKLAVWLRNRQRRKSRRRVSSAGRVIRRILSVLLVLVIVAAAGTFAAWKIILSRIDRTPVTTAPSVPGATPTVPTTTAPLTHPLPEVEGITNILLLGVDNRELEDQDDQDALSDLMIVATIDGDNKVVKLTSFQRDMLVYVPGEDKPRKLTEAHTLGGPEMTMRTLNANFRLDLQHYVEVNIFEAERLIDIVGGIELDVSREILPHANECISMQNVFFPDSEPAEYIEQPGLQRLNGRQAVGYARVRHLDSDYKRMGRQREVLDATYRSFMEASLIDKGRMVDAGLQIITTNMNDSEITKMALQATRVLTGDILQMQVPDPDRYRVDFIETSDYRVRVDLNGIIPQLHDFIYNKIYEFDPVREIPGAPNSSVPMPPGVWLIGEEPPATPTPTATPTPEPSETAEPEPTEEGGTGEGTPTTTTTQETAAQDAA